MVATWENWHLEVRDFLTQRHDTEAAQELRDVWEHGADGLTELLALWLSASTLASGKQF